MPKTEGAAVLILRGPLRLVQARLLKANYDEGVAAVQLLRDYEVHRVLLDDIAEYVGPLDEEED